MNFTGVIAGYDPGGNDKHGLAIADFANGFCTGLVVNTYRNAESVIQTLEKAGQISAIGVDTLAALSTSDSGWRGADSWLRNSYKDVRNSVVSPNGLYGSMGLNGVSVLSLLRQEAPNVQITETHPKVLYWALAHAKYNYLKNASQMDSELSGWLGYEVTTKNDHEWDAVISMLAAVKGISKEWHHDLYQEKTSISGRLVFPVGIAQYWWPE